jgi:hypothetical protein
MVFDRDRDCIFKTGILLKNENRLAMFPEWFSITVAGFPKKNKARIARGNLPGGMRIMTLPARLN